MAQIKMVTVVPKALAKELVAKKRINYNTLPQLNNTILAIIREYMTENVGYQDLPMACLSNMKSHGNLDSEDILHIIPGNSDDSVLFQIAMPEDMIVSISFRELLDISEEAEGISANDDTEYEFLKDRLYDILQVGCDDSVDDMISFIPFLSFEKCQFYARLDDNFEIGSFKIDGLQENSVRQLTSFFSN